MEIALIMIFVLGGVFGWAVCCLIDLIRQLNQINAEENERKENARKFNERFNRKEGFDEDTSR